MGKKLNKEDIINRESLVKLINENKVIQNFTDSFISLSDKGKWLELKGREKKDKKGLWEFVQRKSGKNPVTIIAKDKNTDKYLFVVQPRASMVDNKMVLSFPAGMIDKPSFNDLQLAMDEQNKNKNKLEKIPKRFSSGKYMNEPIMVTAVKELKEETGYFPSKCEIISDPKNPNPKSAGLTDESDNVVECIVDPKSFGTQINERSEDISYLWLDINEYDEVLKKMPNDLIVSENNSWMYMKGLIDGKKLKKRV